MKAGSKVFNEDCLEAMRLMPDNAFDLAICDVPYGINVGNMAFLLERNTTVKQKNGARLNPNLKKTTYKKKDWDNERPTQEYFNQLRRVSHHQIVFGIEYMDWTGVGGGRIVWDKGQLEGVSFKRYETAYASMYNAEVFGTDYTLTIPYLWAGMLQGKSAAEPMIQQGNKALNEKRIHPCHKPTMLYDILFHHFTCLGDKILDTHLGSGSSRIAAYKRGLPFTGYELDKDYYEAQEKRFALSIQQQTIF